MKLHGITCGFYGILTFIYVYILISLLSGNPFGGQAVILDNAVSSHHLFHASTMIGVQ